MRCFEDENITHVESTVDPVRDIGTINLELILADMETVQRRLDRAKNSAKGGDKKFLVEAEFLQRVYDHLSKEQCARTMELSDEEKEQMRDLFLLTSKPVIYAANIAEKDMGKADAELPFVKRVEEFAAKEGSEVLVICAKTEEELSQLPADEAQMFLEELGLKESGLDRLIRKSYSLLGLISYLTAGEKETRAWTIAKGTKAPQAAGKIHTDFEKGFIRAEVVDWQTLLECGSYNAAKEKGKVRSEGKDYVIQDGDVVLFRLCKDSQIFF